MRDGFENEKPPTDNKTPLDSYALSMLAIIVDNNGDLNCTTRWNHYGGNMALDELEISKLIGRNFYEVFKPNNFSEKAMSRIKQGEKPPNVFTKCMDAN